MLLAEMVRGCCKLGRCEGVEFEVLEGGSIKYFEANLGLLKGRSPDGGILLKLALAHWR